MQPRRMSILGVGLLGGSIGLAARCRISGCRIVGYGHRRSTVQAALETGALDEGYDELAPAVREADWVVVCTPVGLFRPLLRELAPLLSPGTIVTDVGSTKRSIVATAEEVFPPSVHFVGSHPMAGSEKRGVQFSRADLYENALCIVTPTPRSNPDAVGKVEMFWQTLGMRTVKTTPEEHDRRLADISHLPHAVAAALVALQEDASLPLTGKGFLDATRIAAGDGGLWRDILLDNRDNVRQSIQRLRNRLDTLDALLEPDKAEALREWLDQAAAKRETLGDGQRK